MQFTVCYLYFNKTLFEDIVYKIKLEYRQKLKYPH